MQFLAGYYGIKVDEVEEPVHGSKVEIEHFKDTLFKDIPTVFNAVRYNSLGIIGGKDPINIENIEYIAFEKGTGAIMALKHSSLPFIGLQYHPESFLSEYGKKMINNFFEIYVEN